MNSSPAKAVDDEWQVGHVVGGRFTILRVIGRGGMGVVFAARDATTNETVALKAPLAELVDDAPLMRRFVREARTVTALAHPHTVRMIEVLEEAGRPVLVMELLEGQSLADRIAEAGRLSVGESARILVPVLDALAHAHANGVVHRDLKPDNIFLARQSGEVVPKVLDFGIAKALGGAVNAESLSLTATGAMLGTPYYMSPEQAAARPSFDHRVDLWSIGVVAYEMLTGTRPFEGQAFGQIFAAIFSEEPRPVKELAPELPDTIVELIGRCLRKPPDERPASAGEIAEGFAAFASLPSVSYPKPVNTKQQAHSDAMAITAEASQSVLIAAKSPSLRSSGGAKGDAPHVTDRMDSVPPRSPTRAQWGAVAAALLVSISVGGWAISRGVNQPAPLAITAPAIAPVVVAPPPIVVAPPSPIVVAASPTDGGAANPTVAIATAPSHSIHPRPTRPAAKPTVKHEEAKPVSTPKSTGIIDSL